MKIVAVRVKKWNGQQCCNFVLSLHFKCDCNKKHRKSDTSMLITLKEFEDLFDVSFSTIINFPFDILLPFVLFFQNCLIIPLEVARENRVFAGVCIVVWGV